MIASRRRFLLGAGATLLAAPAIVRVASLMPVSVLYGGPAGGEMTATEVVASQRRWLDMVTRELERRLTPPSIDLGFGVFGTVELSALPDEVLEKAAALTRQVMESGALTPPARKWFTLTTA